MARRRTLKVVDDDGRSVFVPLDDWFMQEIDRVTMREGPVDIVPVRRARGLGT
jgi:hypothetical protein